MKLAMSKAFTVIIIVFVQPVLFIYVITEVPALSPLTKPVLVTVATFGEDEDQGVFTCGVVDPLKLVIAPTQTLVGPVIVRISLDKLALTGVRLLEVQFAFDAST